MIEVFGYLTWRTLHNRVRRQLRHLRSPRYIIACLLGLAYLWAMIAQQRPTTGPAAADPRLVELLTTVFVAGAIAWAWLFGVERRVLAFSPAEVTFLFPAPVTRRELIRYKLLRTQLVILVSTLLWTLVLAYERLGASTWFRALSIWMLLTTLSFHRLGASFVRTSLAEHGRFGARHRIASLAVLSVVLVLILWSIADVLPSLREAWNAGLPAFLDGLRAAATRPVPHALLAPFRLMVRPLAAEGATQWLLAVVPAALVMVLHYVWVMRSDAAFEEASAEASLDRVRQLSERRASQAPAYTVSRAAGRASVPWQLAPMGWPGGAILWKNLVAALRTRRMRHATMALLILGVLAGVLSFASEPTLPSMAGWFAMTWVGVLVVVGPQWVRNDLRGDLLKLDLLRSYPVRGETVVAAEVAASALVLTMMQWGLLIFVYVAFLGNDTVEFSLPERTSMLVGAIVALPAINFMGMVIQNAAALLYPDWVHLGGGRRGGIEALGQNMLAMIGFMLVLGLTLVPPAGVAWLTFVLVEPMIGMGAVVPAAVLALVLVAFEAKLAVGWLGRVFERTEPSIVLQ